MNRILVVFLVSAGLASASGCGAAQANESDQGNGGGLSYQEFTFDCPISGVTHYAQTFVVAEDLLQPKSMTVSIHTHDGKLITPSHPSGDLHPIFKDGTLSLYGSGCADERRNNGAEKHKKATIVLLY